MKFGVVTLAIGLVGCTVQADDDDWADPPLGEVREALSFTPNLPYPAGTSMGVSQGWGGSWSHTGNLHYAIDFNLPGTADLGIHVLAVADGTVTYRYDDCTCEGCSCNSGWGNAIVIDHGGGEFSKQTHLQTGSIPSWIQVGTPVCRGLYVGDIGNTGSSSGSHLHFQFQSSGTLSGPSMSFDKFAETSGVPQQGGSYLSANQELAECGPPEPCSITVQGDTTVIDDQSDCFHRVGAYWWEESYGHGGHHWFTFATDEPSPDSSASWEVNVAAAGDYQVEVFVPNNPDSLTQAVPYSIHHDGIQDDVTVDQAAHRGEWVALGTYHFAEGGDQEVTIVDNTGEPYGGESGRRLLVDAVRLSTPGECSDACSLGQRCGGEGWQECGNFDSDPCLEWGGGGVCEPGTHCEGQGACVPGEEPVPEEGDEPDRGLEGGTDPDGTDPLADGSNAALHGFTCAIGAPRSLDGSSPAYLLWLLLAAAGLSRQRRGSRHGLGQLPVHIDRRGAKGPFRLFPLGAALLGALAMACSAAGPSPGDGGDHGDEGGAGLGGGSGGLGAGSGAAAGAGSEGGAGAGSPDFCAEPNPDACIGKMDGRWCDLTDVVYCQDDDVLWRIHCSSGCESMPSGTPDRCYPVSFCAAVPDPVSPSAPTEACNYMDWELSPDGFYLISRFGTSADQTTWGHGTTCGYLQGHYDYNSCRYDVHSSSCLDDDYTIPWAQGHVDYDFENVIDTVNTHMIGDVPDPQIFYVADAQRFNCGAVLRVSNPETNRCVIVYTEDGGPGTLYEGPDYGARRTLDASPAVSHYLLVDDWGWANSDLVYVEWGLPGDVPGHACTPCQSTAVQTGTEAMRPPYDPNHMQSGLDCR